MLRLFLLRDRCAILYQTKCDKEFMPMEAVKISIPTSLPSGEIVAVDVTEQDYLANYAENFNEWVEGVVINVSPSSIKHDKLANLLRQILDTYLDIRPLGQTIEQPVVMRLEKSFREPDIIVVLGDNQENLTPTEMRGPADICIEVVSPESVRRDYGDKFAEYEAGGVREYWLIDPIRQTAHFYRLQESGHYATIQLDEDSIYETPLLPGLKLPTTILWQDPLPKILAVTEMVKAMLANE